MLNLTVEQIKFLISSNKFYHNGKEVEVLPLYTAGDDKFETQDSDDDTGWDPFIVYSEEERTKTRAIDENLYFFSYNDNNYEDELVNFGINLADFKRGYYDKGIIYIISNSTGIVFDNYFLDEVEFKCQAIEKLKHENIIDGDPPLEDQIIAELLGLENNLIAEISW